MSRVIRIFVEKKPGFDIEAGHIMADLRENLGITAIEDLRYLNRYDISGLSQEEFQQARGTILSEPNVDQVYDEEFPAPEGYRVFAMEYLPGQYDQRADSAAQCVQLLTQGERPQVLTARVVAVKGNITDEQFEKIQSYLVNPVESRIASLDKPESLDMQAEVPPACGSGKGLYRLERRGIEKLLRVYGLRHDLGGSGLLPGIFSGYRAPGPYGDGASCDRYLLV